MERTQKTQDSNSSSSNNVAGIKKEKKRNHEACTLTFEDERFPALLPPSNQLLSAPSSSSSDTFTPVYPPLSNQPDANTPTLRMQKKTKCLNQLPTRKISYITEFPQRTRTKKGYRQCPPRSVWRTGGDSFPRSKSLVSRYNDPLNGTLKQETNKATR